MILAAAEEGCLHEVLIIAAALSVQDPRERPLEKQEAADACHAVRADEQSDFVSYLKLWDFYHKLKGELSRNQLQKACRQNFLSSNRIREWLDVHRELMELVRQAGLAKDHRVRRGTRRWPWRRTTPPRDPPAHRVTHGRTDRQQYDNVHRAILTGLALQRGVPRRRLRVHRGWRRQGPRVARLGHDAAEAQVARGRRGGRDDAALPADLRTDRPRWIERIAGHLVKRIYHGVHWEPAHASAMALERVTLFGLTIVAGRRIHYGPIDPAMSRHLMIEQGLVEGHIEPKPAFLEQNEALVEELERLQAKVRRRDLLVRNFARYEFYDRHVPAEAYDGATLTKWCRANPHALTMSKADLMREGTRRAW